MVIFSQLKYIVLWLKESDKWKNVFLKRRVWLTVTYRLGETCQVDLYTSKNSCRNLQTTVNWVFHQEKKKKQKNEKHQMGSGKITVALFFPRYFKCRNSILCTQKDKNITEKYRHLWIILWWKSKIFQKHNRYTFLAIMKRNRFEQRNFNSKPMSKERREPYNPKPQN